MIKLILVVNMYQKLGPNAKTNHKENTQSIAKVQKGPRPEPEAGGAYSGFAQHQHDFALGKGTRAPELLEHFQAGGSL